MYLEEQVKVCIVVAIVHLPLYAEVLHLIERDLHPGIVGALSMSSALRPPSEIIVRTYKDTDKNTA